MVNTDNAIQRLKTKIENDKIYLNKELTLPLLARELHTNRTYLTNMFKVEFNTGFTEVINRYRISEACNILKNTPKEQITIEQIAELAGFHSKSAFNKAFKRFKNTTPSKYWASVRNSKRHIEITTC